MNVKTLAGAGESGCDRELRVGELVQPAQTKDNPLGVAYLNQHAEHLDRTIERFGIAAEELHGIADRLLGGSKPPDSDKDKKAALEPCPEGAIGQCQARAQELSTRADRISFAIERLQQVV